MIETRRAGLARSKSLEEPSNIQGILILGEAGAGKTHLLMRVARNLSKSNHILFLRKPNNEDAVAQHVWANVVSSLTRSLPDSGTQRSLYGPRPASGSDSPSNLPVPPKQGPSPAKKAGASAGGAGVAAGGVLSDTELDSAHIGVVGQ